MTDHTILGMPLDVADDDLIASLQPLCGMLIVKGLDEQGNVCYATAATGALSTVECLGMARYAVLKLERALTRDLGDA
jgi:hypothetical protein